MTGGMSVCECTVECWVMRHVSGKQNFQQYSNAVQCHVCPFHQHISRRPGPNA